VFLHRALAGRPGMRLGQLVTGTTARYDPPVVQHLRHMDDAAGPFGHPQHQIVVL
jgi:hypothetical protein